MKKVQYSFLIIGCVILLSGCGVPQEEHDAAITQLQTSHAEEQTALNAKITDLETIVKSEKAKAKSHRLEMDSVDRKLKELQKKNAEVIKEVSSAKSQISSLKRNIRRAEQARDQAREDLADMEINAAQIQADKDELQVRWQQLIDNLNGVNPDQKLSKEEGTAILGNMQFLDGSSNSDSSVLDTLKSLK